MLIAVSGDELAQVKGRRGSDLFCYPRCCFLHSCSPVDVRVASGDFSADHVGSLVFCQEQQQALGIGSCKQRWRFVYRIYGLHSLICVAHFPKR